MNKFTNPLNNIKIASPCSAAWNEMAGDERKRFCGSCQKNVYNLSGMTKDEAENLLLNAEGRLCIRFYKRADGTVLTQDCPVGWAAFKRRVSKSVTAFASLIFGIVGGLGFNAMFNSSKENVEIGQIPAARKVETIERNEPLMGDVSFENTPTAGGISNIDEVRQQMKKHRKK